MMKEAKTKEPQKRLEGLKEKNGLLQSCLRRSKVDMKPTNFRHQDREVYYWIISLDVIVNDLIFLLVCHVEALLLHSSNSCGQHKQNQSPILVLKGLDLILPRWFFLIFQSIHKQSFVGRCCSKALWALWNPLENWIMLIMVLIVHDTSRLKSDLLYA